MFFSSAPAGLQCNQATTIMFGWCLSDQHLFCSALCQGFEAMSCYGCIGPGRIQVMLTWCHAAMLLCCPVLRLAITKCIALRPWLSRLCCWSRDKAVGKSVSYSPTTTSGVGVFVAVSSPSTFWSPAKSLRLPFVWLHQKLQYSGRHWKSETSCLNIRKIGPKSLPPPARIICVLVAHEADKGLAPKVSWSNDVNDFASRV